MGDVESQSWNFNGIHEYNTWTMFTVSEPYLIFTLHENYGLDLEAAVVCREYAQDDRNKDQTDSTHLRRAWEAVAEISKMSQPF